MALLLLGAGAFALLNGCAVGPNFHPPKTAVSPAFANGQQTNLTAAPTAVAWWQGFNDSTLNSLVEQAVATNQDLRIASAHVLEARALRMAAVANFIPPPMPWAAERNRRPPERRAFPAHPLSARIKSLQRRLRCHWELDFFGHVARSVEASSANLAVSEANRQDVLVTLISEVARNYFELRGAQSQLALARTHVDNERQTLALVTARLIAVLGKSSPAGRLPVTWGKRLEDYAAADPKHPERSQKGVDGKTTYSEGVNVGYRWFDKEKVDPLFAFGHGLSYTTFEYSGLKIAKASDGGFDVEVHIKNTGGADSDEVPQVYLGAPAEIPAGVQFPVRALAAFTRVHLAAGESKSVTLQVPLRQLQYWSTTSHAWVTASGKRLLSVGASSRDLRLEQSIE